MFALIGYISLNGQPGQIPICTGANGERILGSLTPGKGAFVLPQRPNIQPTKLRVIE